jgi:hypothetical protein
MFRKINYTTAFCDYYINKGDPLSPDGEFDGRLKVKPYNGNFVGISAHDIVKIDPCGFHYFEKQQGAVIDVIYNGIVQIPKAVDAAVGMFVRPSKRHKWKATSTRKRRTIGIIVSISNEYMQVELL